MIRGYSATVPSARILGEAALAQAELRSLDWVERVPTASNIADGPSRLDYTAVRAYRDA